MEENTDGVSASEVWIAMGLCPCCASPRASVTTWEAGTWHGMGIQQKLLTPKNKD